MSRKFIRWISENGTPHRRELSEEELAERELKFAKEKLRRLTTQKRIYQPVKRDLVYKPPLKKHFKGDYCEDCKRPLSFYAGRRCCECFQKIVRAKHRKKMRAERKRLSIVKAALGEVNLIKERQ